MDSSTRSIKDGVRRKRIWKTYNIPSGYSNCLQKTSLVVQEAATAAAKVQKSLRRVVLGQQLRGHQRQLLLDTHKKTMRTSKRQRKLPGMSR